MEDSLRRRRAPGRVDIEGLDTGRDLEPQPEVLADALGQLGRSPESWFPGGRRGKPSNGQWEKDGGEQQCRPSKFPKI